MVGHAHANRASFRMLEPAWNFPCRRQQKSVTARYALLDDAKAPVVELRVTAYFREIATHQRHMVTCVYPSQFPNALHGGGVTHMATQRIAGVGGIRDHAARPHNRSRLTDQAMLRIVGMNGEELRHE